LKCLITGINGFVGQYLSSYLTENHYEVFGFDNNSNYSFDNEYLYNINILNHNDVKKIISKIEPDYVFHLAGFSSVKRSFLNPELTLEINVKGTNNLLDAIKYSKCNPRILIVSSAEVYGIPQYIPIDEKHPLNPNSPYAESRVKQEKLCGCYSLDIVISRSFNHIGPKQQPIFVCSSFAKQIAEIEAGIKDPIISVGNIDAQRDFTDVRDMVVAYELALTNCEKGELYNICSGITYRIATILQTLLKESEIDIQVFRDKNLYRPSDIPILQGENTKFKKATSWEPRITIDQTLKEIYRYWKGIIGERDGLLKGQNE